MEINGLKSRMRSGRVALVATLQLARTGDVARIFARAGYDALVLDCEHNLIGADPAGEILLAALDAGLAPLIRLPDAAPGPIGRALSAGALGVVIPRIESAEDARAIVHAAAFAPAGRRPLPPVFPHFRRVPVSQAEAVAALTQETLVVAMIETRRGVEQAAAIANVPGVDVLFLGASDLSADLGNPGAKDDDRLWRAAETVAASCFAAGKVSGMGGIAEDHHVARAAGLGMRWLSVAHDATLLQTAAAERAERLRGLTSSR
jgi:2-keto-3-deoxy-L-rhamnonate aldolase RhmA